MAKPSKPKATKQRTRGALPAGYQWRDGRPRWIPSPARRKQGWRGVDLKDGWGRWLALGAAIDRATAINGAVEAWLAGQAVPAQFHGFAPKGAALAGAAAKGAWSPRSIGALLEAYYASLAFTADIGELTRRDYRGGIGAMLAAMAGAADKVERLKRLDVDLFVPPPFGEGDFPLEAAYDQIRAARGDHSARNALRATSAWLTWLVEKRRIWPTNPAALVKMKPVDGRIRVAEWGELRALVATAERSGLASIADAVVLGVDLSWSQQDLLQLTWGQVLADGRVKHRRIKTGVAGCPPLLSHGRERLAAIRARLAAGKVEPIAAAPVLVCEATGRAWEPGHFRRRFAEVRAAAAEACGLPSLVAGYERLTFQDLRDTAITYGLEAGLTVEEICTRSLHSPQRAAAVIAKHYGASTPTMAANAAAKLEAWHLAAGRTFAPLPALPAPA